jgi:hypothetical protein
MKDDWDIRFPWVRQITIFISFEITYIRVISYFADNFKSIYAIIPIIHLQISLTD